MFTPFERVNFCGRQSRAKQRAWQTFKYPGLESHVPKSTRAAASRSESRNRHTRNLRHGRKDNSSERTPAQIAMQVRKAEIIRRRSYRIFPAASSRSRILYAQQKCRDACSRALDSQRGCVTTSTSAGSPRFTTSTARRIAGPRSFGSVIGPSL
jgi:hypothetical protein